MSLISPEEKDGLIEAAEARGVGRKIQKRAKAKKPFVSPEAPIAPEVAAALPPGTNVPKTVPIVPGPHNKSNVPSVFFDDSDGDGGYFFGERKFNDAKALEFLGHLIQSGNLRTSARRCNVHPQTIYSNIEKNPKFKEAVTLAKRESIAILEAEARRRAVEGYDEPVFYQGVKVGDTKKYSDRLMEILLEANDPNKYGKAKRSGEGASGGGGTKVQVLIQQFSDGKIAAEVITQSPQVDQPKEDPEDVEDNSSVQVEAQDVSDEGVEVPGGGRQEGSGPMA